jgi:type II secretory pathway pseudopilin PulG
MIMLNCKQSSRDRQRGVALLMALIALLVIGAITAGAILLSNTESNIGINFRDEQLAFFSAKAGIEEARDRMQAGVTNTLRTASLPTTLPWTTGSVLYILNPASGETVAPWNGSSNTTYPDDEICKETTTITCSSNLPNLSSCNTWCASTTASSVYAASPVLPWKWVRLMLKQNNALTSYSTNGSGIIPQMAAALPLCKFAGMEPMKKLQVVRHPIYLSIP